MNTKTEFNDQAFFKVVLPAAAILAAIALTPISISVGLMSLSAIYAAIFLPELIPTSRKTAIMAPAVSL